MKSFVRLALVLLIPALLTLACGQLPRPFQPEEGAVNELLELSGRAGVQVQADGGHYCNSMAADAMAEGLRQRDLIASTDARNQDSLLLRCLEDVELDNDGNWTVRARWQLYDQVSRKIAHYSEKYNAAALVATAQKPPGSQRIAAKTVDSVAAMILAEAQAVVPQSPRRPLAIASFSAGPGDSASALPQALARELAATDFQLLPQPKRGDLVISGKVMLSPPDQGWQQAVIVWTVNRLGIEKELGQVTQGNRVPAGSLDAPWGKLAEQIARAAAPGLMEIIQQAEDL